MKTIPAEPKWRKVKLGFTDSDQDAGEILVSFAVFSDQFEFPTKP